MKNHHVEFYLQMENASLDIITFTDYVIETNNLDFLIMASFLALPKRIKG
jgi:hypothetical protein